MLARIALILFALSCAYSLLAHFFVVHPVALVVEPPSVAALQTRFGKLRNLSHVQTRKKYHQVLEEAVKPYIAAAAAAGADKRAQAVGCVNARWSARLYARSRDLEGGLLGSRMLGVRDAFTHGIAPHSVRSLADVPACVAMIEGWPCPSYPSLMARKPSDDEIIAGCTRSNALWDRVAETIGEPDVASEGDL
jgi:hypothetical protein